LTHFTPLNLLARGCNQLSSTKKRIVAFFEVSRKLATTA
jgi:hypothetical protein